MDESLIDSLPGNLQRKLSEVLTPGESVFVQLKGAWKEVLVCTDRRVLILKAGLMTGQVFGSNAFQLPYSNVAGVEVKFHLLTGYFELSAGGMQNLEKSYWSTSKTNDPAKAPNCVSLNSRPQATRFRAACTFILERVQENAQGAPAKPAKQDSAADTIERLWKLRSDGIINESEFEILKRRSLGLET